MQTESRNQFVDIMRGVAMLLVVLLNIFKSSVAIQFSSIEGYLLTAGNFALTIGLCAVVIRLLNQNVILKKVFNIRSKFKGETICIREC